MASRGLKDCVARFTVDGIVDPKPSLFSDGRLEVGPTRAAPCGTKESFLVLSDVHLGSDLNDRLPPADVVRRSRSVDADLVKLLNHYRLTPRPSGSDRWRLVIAGDFVDFIGMAVTQHEGETTTALSAEEQLHGLGNSEDHARLKLRRVVLRHGDVFEALAAFVSDGNALTIVHGNHDVEFHWDAVKNEFRRALLAEAHRAGAVDASDAASDAYLGRIEFNPWFFYADGVAYIEHGHQYDPFCATDYVMAPLSPFDPLRIARGFSDVLLRYVVRPTRGMKEYGHEHLGLVDYVAFAVRLGFRGLLDLAGRFAGAVVELFRLRRESLSENARTLRDEHERRMTLLSEATRIGLDRIKALAALQTPPVTRSIRGIMASVLLDRLALALSAALALTIAAFVGARTGHTMWALGCVVLAWVLAHRYLERQRKLDPAEDMVDRAAKLARLFPAAFVVMGHTHIPVRIPVNEGAATYINVGSWAEEEAEANAVVHEGSRAARTHLVIHVGEAGPRAEFLTWDSESGPKTYRS